MKYPPHLAKVIAVLRKLPGVGNKSAERFAFQMLQWNAQDLHEISEVLREIPEKLFRCDVCGCLRGEDPCQFCHGERTSNQSLCIISSPKDAFAIEETREYKGYYHVLGGLLSPLDGIGPEALQLEKLFNRLQQLSITEIVIALDSTIEGDATALYLKRELEPLNLKISRLAFGLPMGSSLDYVDGGTLARAFLGRASF